MTIADQISAKLQIEKQMIRCQRGLAYFKGAQDSLTFIRYQLVREWVWERIGETIIIVSDVAEKAINAHLELLKIGLEKAEQELKVSMDFQKIDKQILMK